MDIGLRLLRDVNLVLHCSSDASLGGELLSDHTILIKWPTNLLRRATYGTRL